MSGAQRRTLALAREVARAAGRPGAARTLLLDVDGTLAPIAPTPEEARVPRAVVEAISLLVERGWTVALVSGRPAEQVRSMVPVRGVLVFGSHGLEGGGAGAELPPGTGERLAALASAGAALAEGFPGVRFERKPAGLAFHDRALDDPALRRWRERLERWLARQELEGLERLEGKRVVELRPRGVHKGRVVAAVAAGRVPGIRDESFVAVGDDRTDEDMFVEIRDLGLAVHVGSGEAGTAATRRLGSPAEVAAFLERLSASP